MTRYTLALLLAPVVLFAQGLPGTPGLLPTGQVVAGPIIDAGDFHILPVQGNVYMVTTGGNEPNTTLEVGPQGVVVVNAQSAALADKLLAAIRKLTDKPLRYIIDTNASEANVGGNGILHKAGIVIIGANAAPDTDAGAPILSHENVLVRMSAGDKPAFPVAAWPTDTFLGDEKDLFINGESIQILHAPNANTDGDSFTYFRKSDVVSAGDLFATDRYPSIEREKGGTIQGVIEGLDHIMALTIVAHEEEGGTMVIPGHGRLCDQADVVEYRDMVAIVRDRLKDMIKRGLTLEQAKAAQPTREYDKLYGNPDSFVTAAYQSLLKR